MKHGLEINYWNEYIFQAYCNFSNDVIYLTGTELGKGQSSFVASPEKALLDLLYLTPGSDDLNYQNVLRLQNLETLDFVQLTHLAQESRSQKLLRAIKNIMLLMQE